MNLQKKILLSFVTIIIVFTCLLFYTISTMKDLHHGSVELYDDRLVPTAYLAEINRLTENTRLSMVQAVLNEDATMTEQAVANLEQINVIVGNYGKTKLTVEEEEALNRFKKDWGLFEVRVQNNRELIVAGQYEEALVGIRAGGDLYKTAALDLVQLVTINDQEAMKLLEEGKSNFTTTRTTIIIGSVVILLAAIIYSFLFSRYLTTAINKIVTRLHQVAEGDLSGDALSIKSKDELGVLASGMNQMQTNLRQLVQQTTDTSQQVSASSEELSASAEQSTDATEQMAKLALESAEGAEQQLQQLNEVSAAVEQMSASMSQIASSSQEMANFSEQAADHTTNGSNVIELVNEQMHSISEAVSNTSASVKKLGAKSAEISDIVHLITGIAEQTNLLALNAAIEAARAGQYGKGFAVVADEVRKLAEESKESAAKIHSMITEIQKETHHVIASMEDGTTRVETGLKSTNQVTRTFAEIQESIEAVTKKVHEVSTSIQEMTSVSTHVVESVEIVKSVSEKNVAASQDSSASSQEQLATMEEIAASSMALAKVAEELQESIQTFRI
ncbi:methyl-accepting chemotaxis protein [Bacillus suaedae]|uniref:Methyl-accepting chemotaxis protein n=1 Tax=Halalkalibacter suaedae TaxID=2822140 RepID=A0A941AMQ6_9BACI|nr:HAMP domain-containing methyl-accepting chemotaxis protein [Bacillus suaedae]MBP3950096.1 methyl-accepting chemotaxis protein [Bacillus suaedae]